MAHLGWTRRSLRTAGLLAVWAALLAPQAQAHVGGDGFLGLVIDAGGVQGQWILSRAAVARAAGLPPARTLPRGGGRPVSTDDAMATPVLGALSVTRDGRDCVRESASLRDHEDPNYLVLRFELRCEPRGAGELTVRDTGPIDGFDMGQHVVRVRDGPRTQLGLLDARHHELRFTLAPPERGALFAAFLKDGISHISHGCDHLLFLVTLLLPAVLRPANGHWTPMPRLGGVLADTMKMVTAFTLAHSLTLSLAVLQWVRLPARVVEPSIAASVLLVALGNLRPRSPGHRWPLAFGFGLIHGMGFASALAELQLPSSSLAVGLVGFNAGIEAGQVALVAMFLPLAFALRRTRFYSCVLLTAGSMLASLWASIWMVERIFDVQLLPPDIQ